MKISKTDLCNSCLKIRPRMNDGSLGMAIEDLLDSKGYNQPMGFFMGNHAILLYLQENGGCSSCINLFQRATGS